METASEYAQRGWAVFPVHYALSKGKCSCGKADCSNPGKHPMTKQGLKDASKDPKQIKEWWGKHPQANIGIATGEASGLVVVDIDPRHGGLESMKAIGKLGNLPVMTPTVATGGGGEHIYLAYPNNGTKIRNTVELAGYQGVDLRGEGGYVIAPPSRHISGGRYTWKVRHIGKAPARMPEWFIELATRRPTPAVSPETALMLLDKNTLCASLEVGNSVTLAIPEGQRDNILFHLAKTFRKGGMPIEEIMQYVVMIAQRCCHPPVEPKVAIEKVRSTFLAERNLGAEIRDWLALQKGFISITECDHELQIVTGRDKALRRQVIFRAVDAKILERIENRPGVYRIVNSELEEIDFRSEDNAAPLPIKWPLGLENLIDIMPTNIIVVAGSKDAGKTAFCLNTVLKNQHNFKINYLSSEMGAPEMRRRLLKFDVPIDSWRFKAYLRSGRFGDAIVPDAFNIVDYLEISKDFSVIAEEIRSIYDHLTTGICLIAIQKDPKAEFGRGASFSIEKARMYLTLDSGPHYNLLTIKSGKNWHQETVNPKNMQIRYKLINGAKIKDAD